jgi:bifunctional N-acetylglucosamine-1-phosphate-uridyltransferase/glucosamine-1-phosphate-acetyltransferase GlmU-like protein
MGIITDLARNPFTIWLNTLRVKWKLTKVNSTLRLGYLCQIKDCSFENNVTIFDFVTLSDTSVGSYSYVNSGSQFRKVVVGKFCSIGTNVVAGLGIHPTHFVSTHPAFYSFKPSIYTFASTTAVEEEKQIRIGHDVWIGSYARIMDGVTIGNGAVIAAGAIVTTDVPDYAIVGGVPAKVIKYRFDESTCQKLLESKWWDRDENWFKANCPAMQDVSQFFAPLKN